MSIQHKRDEGRCDRGYDGHESAGENVRCSVETKKGSAIRLTPKRDGDRGSEVVDADDQAHQAKIQIHLNLHYTVENAYGEHGEHSGCELT